MTGHASILTKTWVAVFDGGKASAFENEGFDDAPNLRFVFGSKNDNPVAHEQGRDRPGRFDTPAGGRAAASAADPHERREERFVQSFIEGLDAAARAEKFDRLVVIAPAALINRLREAAPAASAKVAATSSADLAHAPMDKIERAFIAALRG